MRATRENIRRLLRPRSIAFIGGRAVERPVRRSVADGFAGAIAAVNPATRSIAGQPCFASIADLPQAPDAAFVAVRRELTIDTVAELARIGAGGAVCYASGFAETGGDGGSAQARLVEASGSMALLGPNCFGIVNCLDGATLWPGDHGGRRVGRGTAILTQSGNMGFNLTMAQRSLPLAYMISLGNQAALHAEDLIEILLEDDRITAIGLHLETIVDVERFGRVAMKALEQKVPIVALKVGSSETGARLAVTHTASLAGSDECYAALFRRLGIARTATVPAFLETLKMAAMPRAPQGRRLRVMTCSGGDAELVADAAAREGLALPELSPGQIAELRPLLPDFAAPSNPLDFTTKLWGDRDALERCFRVLLADSADVGVFVLDYPRLDGAHADPRGCDAAVDAVLGTAAASDIPISVVSVLPESLPEAVRERLVARGVAPLQGLDEALAAIGRTAALAEHRRAWCDGSVAAPPLRRAGALTRPTRVLDEWESKRLLRDAGIAVPQGRAASPETVSAAARELRFPLVLKAVDAALPHKTDLGVVALGLSDQDAVSAAATRIMVRLRASSREPERLLIEEMITDGVAELLVGVRRDPQFGPVLVIGFGGIFAELLQDTCVLLLPTSPAEIRRALLQLRLAPLLHGYRGAPPGDVDAAVAAIAAIARVAESLWDDIDQLEVNPLIVRPRGRGAIAVDALTCLAAPEGARR